ncbi:MAG: sensor histidine kinase [Lachnospiraceae bacterium]
MDTKLKNKHRLGVFLTWLLVIAAAAGMVGAYPYIWERAENWKARYLTYEIDSLNRSRVDNVAALVQNGAYGMWMEEVQNHSGKKLQPSQVFVPELEGLLENRTEAESAAENMASASENEEAGWEEYEPDSAYLEEVRRYIDEMGAGWDAALQTLKGPDNVRVIDKNGQVLSKGTPDIDYENDAVVKITFDNMGRCSYAGAAGNKEAVQILEEHQYVFSNVYGGGDPLAAQFGRDYVYEGLSFSGPENRTYEFVIEKEMILGTEEPAEVDMDDLTANGIFLLIWSALAVFLVAAAWLLPLLPIVSLGTGKVSRAPLALVGSILFADAFLVICGGGMIETAMNGELMNILAQIFAYQGSSEIVGILNGLYWAVTFGIVFWSALCVRSIFTLGPVRYFKERTVTGWCCRWILGGCRWIKKYCVRFLDSIIQTDWQESSNKMILKIVIANFVILTVICCLWFFGIFALIVYSIVLFVILKRYWEKAYQKYQVLLSAINEMADGNLDVKIEEDLGIFAPFYSQLLRIQNGFKKAVQEEVKSQRMKTELITNVSHDLKTPLTAIITYVNLLEQEDITEEERRSYIEVLEGKSLRLKSLIEDLFEVSKANSGITPLNLVEVDIVSLLKQVRLELGDRIEASGIDFRWNLPEEKVILNLDSQKTYRVFENLLVNITKYALPGTRAYVEMQAECTENYGEERGAGQNHVVITMKNISAAELNVSPNELTERFVRGDVSRNTEGSGLGLAIAKSFVELQGGKMEIEVEADLFKVTIRW